jgi:hypothetical protein
VKKVSFAYRTSLSRLAFDFIVEPACIQVNSLFIPLLGFSLYIVPFRRLSLPLPLLSALSGRSTLELNRRGLIVPEKFGSSMCIARSWFTALEEIFNARKLYSPNLETQEYFSWHHTTSAFMCSDVRSKIMHAYSQHHSVHLSVRPSIHIDSNLLRAPKTPTPCTKTKRGYSHAQHKKYKESCKRILAL